MSVRTHSAVVIGASAGALDALSTVLPALPKNYPLPVFVVVHVPPDKVSVITEIFRTKCKIKVKEAEDKEPILPGCVYFAPPNYHLLIEANDRLSLSSEEAVLFSRPSIDVLFETAADAYGKKVIGIILTGANHDGTSGLKSIYDAGGIAIVQTPSLAYASTMPQAALDASPNAKVLSLDKIAAYLKKVKAA